MKPFIDKTGYVLTRFALANAVPMNLLFIVLVFVGAITILNMPVDVYPDVVLDEATVHTFWLGASAEDVERLVTSRIEDKILDIRGVDRVISDSKADLSRIRVKFLESLSPNEFDASLRELRAAVDQVTDLPDDAEKPVVRKISVAEVFYLLMVVIVDEGGVGEAAIHDVAYRLKSVLREVPGVGKVDDQFIRDREIRVLARQEELRKYSMTLGDLATILEQYNRDIPSGTLTQGEGEFTIRAAGGVIDPEQLGSIVVFKNPSGGHVYLRDVAVIQPGFQKSTLFPRFNMNRCLVLGVAKRDEADSRTVVADVHDAMEAFSPSLPEGVALNTADDSSDIIESRLSVLGSNLGWGVVLVLLVLFVTIGLRNSILAIIGIPFSFCCALIFMRLIGVTINAVSLIGLVLCTGMVVDDAIVVLENIYRHVELRSRAKGDRLSLSELKSAIVDGTWEVFWPVISSSATTVAAFLPLLIMTGITGEFFSIIPKTVTVVLASSLVECLFVLPVHYLDWGTRGRRVRKPVAKEGADRTASLPDDPEAWTPAQIIQNAPRALRGYGRMVGTVLRYRYLWLLPLFGAAVFAWALIDFIPVELFPSDFQHCLVDVKTRDEASLEETERVVAPLEKVALEMGPDDVSAVLTWVGIAVTEENDVKIRQNVAQLHVQLASTTNIGADSSAVAAKLRERIETYLDTHPDLAVERVRVWAPRAGPAVGKPVAVRIQCPDFAKAKQLTGQLEGFLSRIEGVHGIGDNLDFGQQQIHLILDEDRASVHGLTFLHAAAALRSANDGVIVSTFKDRQTGEDLDVRLMLAESDRRTLDDLLDVDLRSARNYIIRLGDIADVDVMQGYAGIPHYNGHRVVTVTAEVDSSKTTAQEVNEKLIAAFDPILADMPDVRATFGGEYEETARAFGSLKEAFAIAVVVIYMLLATQFRNYAQPFIIIVTVPFAFIGVVSGLYLSGYPFTIMTFIAVVGMSGVVVNDSILLVDNINRQRSRGFNLDEAIRVAAIQRFRPILLTTITTVMGLAPLALGIGGYSKIWSPFASSFVWGLLFSTIITLLYIPIAYRIVWDTKGLFYSARSRSDEPTASVAVE